jgi:MazG family protein
MPTTSSLGYLVEIVDQLRDPSGCPWDRQQTLASMRPYLLEECYELLEAMESPEPGPMREELGDLLFVILLLSRICQDRGWFGVQEAAGDIAEKMVRRHPHVFAGETLEGDPSGIAAWENRKQRDPGRKRYRLDGVPRSLPGLLRAHRQGEKVAAVGFDWPDAAAVMAKVDEELGELRQAIESGAIPRIEHELGDLLMAISSLGRHLGTPPEAALRLANDRFASRFGAMEDASAARERLLQDMSASELEQLWEEAKAREEASSSHPQERA